MAIHKIPTLILGVGGIGCRIAANISDLLRPEDRENIAIIGMDTNVNDLNQLATRGIRTIQTSDDRKVGEYLRMHPEYMRWFPVNPFTVSRGMLNGAGQIRAISRLAALAAEENGMFVPIREEIQRIRENRGQAGGGNMTVMVVGSITGGTGAGLFLQMPFYIRKVMRNEANLNIIVRGMFVGPDLTVDVQPSKINQSAMRVNAYACLKELNALYRRQTQNDTAGKLKVDFYEPMPLDRDAVDDMRDLLQDNEYFDEQIDPEAIREDSTIIVRGNPDIPYDYLYLIEGSTVKGGIGNAPLGSVESLVAQMVHTLMFTPVSDNALSIEDNMVLKDMETGGMNRYSSAGLSRLVFPRDLAREYVTLCAVRDLVKEEWLLVDQDYADDAKQARSLQNTDGQVEIPKLKDSFPKLFENHVKSNGNRVAKLGKLYKEAYIQTDDSTEKTRAEVFFEGIGTLIDQMMQAPDVEAAKTACAVNMQKMGTFASAIQHSSTIYTALGDYEKLARKLIGTRPVTLANEVFPPSEQGMRGKKENSQCIYRLLAGVHPLTARFLCYDLLLRMEARRNELEGELAGVNLGEYLEEDFDGKEDKVQNATVALKKMQQKQNPIIGAVFGESGSIKKIRNRLESMATTQTETITGYLRNSVEKGVLDILIERVEALAENYRIFFQTIETMIQQNNVRIKELESLNLPLGQIGVYCSKDAFRSIAADYQSSCEIELPVATKTAVFESMFKVLAEDFARKNKVETERQKKAYAAKKAKTLNKVFCSAVRDTVRTNVEENGSGIVDLNIYQALEKQYELEMPDDLSLEGYLRARVEEAMRVAAPMLATSSNAMAENTETVYLAMHPDCAATEMGEPSDDATQQLFAPQACEATDGVRAKALLDEAFSPYEIICFKARYKFSIGDLVKYGPYSDNAKAYNIRIGNLGKTLHNVDNSDMFKTVVNPHLDRYWHEEAYLPALYESTVRKDRVNSYKAFIYAIGLDLFVSQTDESVLDEQGNPRTSWYFDGRSKPLTVRGGRVGGGYIDLFRALPFNGAIKKEILRSAEKRMHSEKGYKAIQQLKETILDTAFIQDLIQPSGTARDCEENILDIILGMRDSMLEDDWKNLFVGLREALWEYCAFLFDENERIVNDAMKVIMDKMIANSTVGAKAENDRNYSENELVRQAMAIRNTIYRRN